VHISVQIAAALIGLAGALIGFAGGIASAILTDRLRRRRSMPDRQQLKEWLLFFDRPAWKGPMTAKSHPEHYEKVLADTIKAINTGLLATRSGSPLGDHQARGKSELRDKKLRAQMDDVTNRVERIRALLRQRNDSNYTSKIIPEIDRQRDQIVETLNDAALRFGLKSSLQIPTKYSFEDVYEM
jgi:hypothetical protein